MKRQAVEVLHHELAAVFARPSMNSTGSLIRSTGSGIEHHSFISTALAGAPSPPTTLSGRHKNVYSPGSTFDKSSPSSITIPFPKKSLCTACSLLVVFFDGKVIYPHQLHALLR